ncbi:MAG: PrgI family protein [Candidatus Daviesbacteria bacterium]|nr:PrgI family protein [Candidatus Daviesbacteria bacterium]
MRTTVIPAQITTVEDKIAGSLNLTQIILLLVSLFVATFIYATFPQRLSFSMYKIIFIAIQFFFFVFLSLRIKGKVVINWLFILSSYYLRPGFYIYSKNDTYLRDISYIAGLEPKKAAAAAATVKKTKAQTTVIPDLLGVEKILGVKKDRLSFKFDKNGGLDAIWQVKS